MRKHILLWGGAVAFAAVVVGCATAPTDLEVSRQAAAVLKDSFKAKGQAGLDRLDQDETQRLCTLYANKPLPKDVAQMIEKIKAEPALPIGKIKPADAAEKNEALP